MPNDHATSDDLEEPLILKSPNLLPEEQSKCWRVQKILEVFFDWAPLIIVNFMTGVISFQQAATISFFVGALGLLPKGLKARSMLAKGKVAVFPKILDIGQVVLFGTIVLVAMCFPQLSDDLEEWNQVIVNGGFAIILLVGIVIGRPFVLDYAQEVMPREIFDSLSSKKYFMSQMNYVAGVWLLAFSGMTVSTLVAPVYHFLLGAKIDATWDSFFFGAQFVFLAIPIYTMRTKLSERNEHLNAIKHIMKDGVDRSIYPLHQFIDAKGIHITSVTNKEEMERAAMTLTEAFHDDEEMFGGWLKGDQILEQFRVQLAKIMYFGLILQAGDGKAIMACLPGYDNGREVRQMSSAPALLLHGWNLPLPSDLHHDMAELKNKEMKGRPYLFIAYFGASNAYRGKGYGRSLLTYGLRIADEKGIPTVLETMTVENRRNYEKFGFVAKASVPSHPHVVLMVREPQKT